MIVIVCGSRNLTDGEKVFAGLDRFHAKTPITFLIEGGQRLRDKRTRKIIGGVDYWAGEWARKMKIKTTACYAQWNKFGRSAGPMRNMEMLVKFKPESVVAFPGGTGTADMIRQAKGFKVPVVHLA